MNTQLQTSEQAMTFWEEKRDDILKSYIPQGTPKAQVEMFFEMGKALGANPFTREIFLSKYNTQQGPRYSIFCGRDFYRRKAQEQKEYDGHYAEAVFTNDEFQVVDGEPHHKFSVKNRGQCVGAYAVVYRKNTKKPTFVYVEFKEYTSGQATWKQKPTTMIKKVAEAQALRAAFQGTFSGTYEESEQWEEKVVNPRPEDKAVATTEGNQGEAPVEEDQRPFRERVESIRTLGELSEFEKKLWKSDEWRNAAEQHKQTAQAVLNQHRKRITDESIDDLGTIDAEVQHIEEDGEGQNVDEHA